MSISDDTASPHDDLPVHDDRQVIEVLEETATVTTRDRVVGRVRITTSTDMVEEVHTRELQGTYADVAYVPVNRMLAPDEPLPRTRTEGNVTIVPVFEEIVVMETRIILKEELHITKQNIVETVSIPVTLRKQTATVVRTDPEDPCPALENKMSDYTSNASSQYVTAFFDSRADADAAVERIVAEGVSRNEVQIVDGRDSNATVETHEDEGFFEKLGNFFMPDEDRLAYAEGLKRGGYLVSLNVTAQNRDRILDILDDEGTVDMDAREETWRSEGWSGAGMLDTGLAAPGMTGSGMGRVSPEGNAAMAADYGTTGTAPSRNGDMVDGTIDVVQENLRVGKREVEHGRVRVRSYVVETPVEEQVNLHSESVHIERRPVDRAVDAGMATFDDQTLEATETAEEAVVSKEARVVEEITLNKEVDDRTETVRDTVRHTEVEIDDDRTDPKK